MQSRGGREGIEVCAQRNRQLYEFVTEFRRALNVVSPTGFEPVLLP
jgi:hypothetical protein